MSRYELDDDLVRRFLSTERSDSDHMAICLHLEEQLPQPALIDPGTVFPAVEVRYSGGVHYPKNADPHPLAECNRNQCGPKL